MTTTSGRSSLGSSARKEQSFATGGRDVCEKIAEGVSISVGSVRRECETRKENSLVATTYVRRIRVSDSTNFTTVKRASRQLSASLWTLQVLLALIFVLTGS